MSCVSGRSGLSGGGERVVSGFGRRMKWLKVLLILGLVAGFGIFVSEEEGTAFSIELPADLVALMEEAVAACDKAASNSLNSGCPEAVWIACDRASTYGSSSSGRVNWEEYILEERIELEANRLPEKLLCRSAHMAELGELAASLAKSFSEDFYSEPKDVSNNDYSQLTGFWEFRQHITYTPWDVSEIYGSRTFDNGPWITSGGHSRSFGRWLNEVQDWGREEWKIDGFPTPVTASDVKKIASSDSKYIFVFDFMHRLAVQMMMNGSGDSVNSVLRSVGNFTKQYDSWPVDEEYELLVAENFGNHNGQIFNGFWRDTLGNELYDDVREMFGICLSAVSALKKSDPNWETTFQQCQQTLVPCRTILKEVDAWCEEMLNLVQFEYNWQELPRICAQPQQKEFKGSACYQSVSQFCNSSTPSVGHMNWFDIYRLRSLKFPACQLVIPGWPYAQRHNS